LDQLPLDGVRVLDLTRGIPGGYCTLALAQLGADVVKVEAPGTGDTLRGRPHDAPSALHVGLGRGKRSITLDVRAPGAAQVVARLVPHFDALVESARPGTPAVAGFGREEARALNPRLVWASLTGFGTDGPYAPRPGHDVTFLGHSGLLAALTASEPVMPDAMLAVPVGALAAAFGIVAAVLGAVRHGRALPVDAAITEASTWLLGAEAAESPRRGMGWTAGRRLYRCADGRFVTVAAAEPRTWRALCDALGTPDWYDRLGDGPAGQREMAERFEAVFASRPATHWVDGSPDATIGAVHRSLADLAGDAQAAARGAVGEVAGHRVPGPPVRVGGAGDGASSAPPGIGASTDAVLAGAGFTPEEVAALRRAGVV